MTSIPFIALCVLILGLLASNVQAKCVSLKLKRSQDGATTQYSKRTTFKPNDQFVVCFRLGQSGFVSVWDAPPHGPVSRLYPNVLTHKNSASIRAAFLAAGRDYCFGTPETFPLFFPEEQGVGLGKISVIVTKNIKDQPSLDAYDIPGRSIRRARMDEVSRRYRLADRCGDRMSEYFPYSISK